MTRQTQSMPKLAEDCKDNHTRFVQVRQTAGGITHYRWVPTRYRKLPGCPRSRALGNNLASEAAKLSEQFNVWQVQRVKRQLGIQQPAGPCPAGDENESSTEFQNGRRNRFPNAAKNLNENKAVSLNNTVLWCWLGRLDSNQGMAESKSN